MNNITRSAAQKFSIYSKLSWFDQWIFRLSLRWVSSDSASLNLLLKFEQKLEEESLFSGEIFDILIHALIWYNQENHNEQIKNRLPHDNLPEMLEIVLIFLDKNPRLHFQYRDLILNIVNAANEINKSSTISPKEFRIKTAESISKLPGRGTKEWGNWDLYRENGANYLLNSYKNLANKIDDLQLFARFQTEAEKLYCEGNWYPVSYLESVACNVKDLQSFEILLQKTVPVIGMQATACLLAIPKDFQEFEIYYERVATQLATWDLDCISLLGHLKNVIESRETLIFLETLLVEPQMQKCIQYHQSKNTKYARICLEPLKKLSDSYPASDWQKTSSTSHCIDNLINLYILNLVNLSLHPFWSCIASKKIRWEFDQFTDYIPVEKKKLDWMVDSEGTRQYWNWQKGANLESDRFRGVLAPKLCRVFRELEFSDYDLLVKLLPDYITTQEFKKAVQIPTSWMGDIIVEEGYQRHVGFYDVEVQVLRPLGFIEHIFTFERLDLQKAMDFLDDLDKVHEAIQSYKNLR